MEFINFFFFKLRVNKSIKKIPELMTQCLDLEWI